MNIAEIRIVKHVKLKFEDHVTHVFTFAEPVDPKKVVKHPAISAYIQNQAISNYMILDSDCEKTIRLKVQDRMNF